MTANLATFEDGRVRMDYWGRIPVWHKTGQESESLLTVEEVEERGTISYPVGTRQHYWRDDEGTYREAKGVAIVREDTQEVLSYASDKYTVIQNSDMLDLFRKPIASGESAGIMTCGALGRGERSWVQAVIGDFGVDSVDRGIATLLALNSFDSSEAFQIGFAATWVVCGNTYAAAAREFAGDSSIRWKVTHQGKVEDRLREINAALDIANRRIRSHEEIAKELVKVRQVSAIERWKYTVACVPISDVALDNARESGKLPTFWANQYKAIQKEWITAPGMDLETRRGTAFGAWNAITGWVDYGRQPNQEAHVRARSLLSGSGRDIKDRALHLASDHFLGGADWDERTEEVAKLAIAAV